VQSALLFAAARLRFRRATLLVPPRILKAYDNQPHYKGKHGNHEDPAENGKYQGKAHGTTPFWGSIELGI
jgi:hypothetical protein